MWQAVERLSHQTDDRFSPTAQIRKSDHKGIKDWPLAAFGKAVKVPVAAQIANEAAAALGRSGPATC